MRNLSNPTNFVWDKICYQVTFLLCDRVNVKSLLMQLSYVKVKNKNVDDVISNCLKETLALLSIWSLTNPITNCLYRLNMR